MNHGIVPYWTHRSLVPSVDDMVTCLAKGQNTRGQCAGAMPVPSREASGGRRQARALARNFFGHRGEHLRRACPARHQSCDPPQRRQLLGEQA
jgi:hypothetical protein